MTGYRESIEKKREDAKEMIEILEKIPKERKPEALALVKGFALCAELDEKKVGWGKVIWTVSSFLLVVIGIALIIKWKDDFIHEGETAKFYVLKKVKNMRLIKNVDSIFATHDFYKSWHITWLFIQKF